MKNYLFRSVSIVALASAALSAHAGLTGSTVNLQGLFPDDASVYSNAGNAVVGAGVEFGYGSLTGYEILQFDFTDTGLIITSSTDSSFTSASFNGFQISVVSGPSITGASYVSGAAPGISMSGSNLLLNYQGQSISAGEYSRIDITTDNSPSVPGPAAIVPFVLGGVATLRRRRKA